MDILNKTSRRVNGSWEVGLLWKSDSKISDNGKANALYRLKLLERKLDRDSEYADKYYREMNRLIENGFAIKARESPKEDRQWYLLHFGVQNINKPGKVRLVFDAAA